MTQKLLFVAIYERWNEVKASDAADRLGVSRMSVSRCSDELEYLNIDVLSMKGKSRVISVPDDFEAALESMRRTITRVRLTNYPK